MKKYTIALLLLILALPALAAREVKFEVPSVKDDYCGVDIAFQNCKCAFHNEYCEAAEKNDSYQSRIYVMSRFNSHVDGLVLQFATNCIKNGGKWNKPTLTCTYLDELEQLAEDLDTRSPEDKYGLPNMDFKPEPKSSTVKGKVYSSDGEVFIWSASFRKWIGPVRGGMLIYNGDVVKTTSRGEARLLMYGDGGVDTVNVHPETFLEVPDPTNFKEHDSSLWGIIKDTALEVYNAATSDRPEVPTWYRQLHTPTVVLGTRGTRYVVVSSESAKRTEVYMQEGEAEITPLTGGDTVTISAGESYLYDNSEISTSTMSEADWEEVLNNYELASERQYFSEEDLVAPTEQPTDPDVSDVNEEELLPDRNYFEEQIGSVSGALWWIIISLLILGGGAYYWKKKKV